jgi:hypothetical protein
MEMKKYITKLSVLCDSLVSSVVKKNLTTEKHGGDTEKHKEKMIYKMIK